MSMELANRTALTSLARLRSKTHELRTASRKETQDLLQDGWAVVKENKATTRLSRLKPDSQRVTERLWCLLFKMEFEWQSAKIPVPCALADGRTVAFDVVAADEEVTIILVAVGQDILRRREKLKSLLEDLTALRPRLSQALRKDIPSNSKRQIAFCLVAGEPEFSIQVEKVDHKGVLAFLDLHDLAYYEALTAHLGAAARYQFLADVFGARAIPGLDIRVPAVRSKMGGANCYTFSVAPEYLLKVAYVSHRAKGRASDVDTYQRMMSRSRLSRIRDYISKEGIFPTNIVVNIESAKLRFERIQQDANENGTLGWLEIKGGYKVAWVIDGQHRLFSYSGHEGAAAGRLSVLAFEGLPPSKQAGLFIDINSKQKRVKQSLLQELHAELHWDSDDPDKRVSAVISKAIQVLTSDRDSPFFGRIQTADLARDQMRCISLTSLFGALERGDLFIARRRERQVLAFGPFWLGTNEDTLLRTVRVMKAWFGAISEGAAEWWERGAEEGGGLAMNDGAAALVGVLRSVMQHLGSSVSDYTELSDAALIGSLLPFGEALGRYLGGFSASERRAFRDLRGNQGLARRVRLCEKGLRESLPNFNPAGLVEFLESEKIQSNAQAKVIVDRLEAKLQEVVVSSLKACFGEEESGWWMRGVPKNVRLAATELYEKDDGARGGKEKYLNLIDYRVIAKNNKDLFERVVCFGRGNWEKRTDWIRVLNDKRRALAHPSSGVSISIGELGELTGYEEELLKRLRVADDTSESRP